MDAEEIAKIAPAIISAVREGMAGARDPGPQPLHIEAVRGGFILTDGGQMGGFGGPVTQTVCTQDSEVLDYVRSWLARPVTAEPPANAE